ncbi:unnamed protein product [Polarella glacialis]|uniref:Uncharacterized protein n=1 Tax=Polarella glacialis TaxID=89957 RepID=A0A813E7T5_POLGL|nr:unnamed protein product [Polarella glacialis]
MAAFSPRTLQSRQRKLMRGDCQNKIFLGIACKVPGRVVPTTGICVDDKVRIGDILRCWAANILKEQGGHLPMAARVTGASNTDVLDLDATLQQIRRKLPVKDGRLTLSVTLPAQAFNVPLVTAPKPVPRPVASVMSVSLNKPNSAEDKVRKAVTTSKVHKIIAKAKAPVAKLPAAGIDKPNVSESLLAAKTDACTRSAADAKEDEKSEANPVDAVSGSEDEGDLARFFKDTP